MNAIIALFLQDSTGLATESGSITIGHWIAIAAIVVPIMSGYFIYLVVLSFRLGQVIARLNQIDADLKSIKDDVKSIPVLMDRVNVLWKDKVSVGRSPLVLNDIGRKILLASRIEELTTQYYYDILEKVRRTKPQNQFQGQESLIAELGLFKNFDKCKSLLEKAAFNAGSDIDTILLVAALNIRDMVLHDLNLESP